MNFSDAELDRYARHLVLREVGGAGQAALKAARVVVIGAGGIGSPALQYLAAAGIGTLVVIDDDQVDTSNLQRQTLFGDADIGTAKVAAAATAIARINPFVTVVPHRVRIDAANAADLLAGAQVVLDGCDNFATRLTVADAALAARIPLVSAAVGQFEGQLGVFRGWEPQLPCYRCFVGDDPARADASCADQGVLGALTGIMGSMAALEVMRAIVGFGDDTAGKLLIADLLGFRFRTLTLPKDPGCRCAG
ncbi:MULTISPECIES: HesA/MoeB/ThiF family protein [unclassified Sphingomonas]|uniref:HesA/MoeB/ThiF family protein n=1 Tax=unclassified Sphingomonas TaxID=196159 RepID=UPI0006FEFDF2|nr:MULTISPECIES: molybdopterin-synthase adenylyltransferase MoeB [unclassified Sphingomonas]KQM24633.1 molybdopterin biosynthesis protein MoeB [Sphingomonas sp. Leaf9]KQM42292.1 molybdopterin biosynthesis protein MoeB [Sphingomonas sp. Leaf11]